MQSNFINLLRHFRLNWYTVRLSEVLNTVQNVKQMLRVDYAIFQNSNQYKQRNYLDIANDSSNKKTNSVCTVNT